MEAKEQQIREDYTTRIADMKAARLEPLRRNIPLDSRGLTLLCVARNEGWRLPAFFDHYRGLGVRRFVFADNDSTDDSRDFLAAQPDTDLWLAPEKFNGRVKMSWYHRLMAEYGYNAWYLVLDADEHIVYHGCENNNLDSLIALAEHDGNTRLRGVFVDMYSNEPLSGALDGDPPGDVREECPYFDASPFEFGICETHVFAKGGTRLRMFQQLDKDNFAPAMTKYPLAFVRKGDFTACHHMAPVWANFISQCVLGMLHYKFARRDRGKLDDALKNGQYYQNSREYRCYAEWLEKYPGQSLMCECSKKYRSSQDLVDAGIVVPLNWQRPSETPTVYRAGLMDSYFNKFRYKMTQKMKQEKKFWDGLKLPVDF